LITLMLLVMSSSISYGSSNQLFTVDDFFSNYDKVNKSDLEKIEELLTQAELDRAAKIAGESTVEVDLKNAIKSYNFKDTNTMIAKYKTTGDLENLISDSYMWIVPIINSEGKHVCSARIDGTVFKIIGYKKINVYFNCSNRRVLYINDA